MKITIAEYVSMAETGHSLLDLMQNNKTPVLDLLVRESIQNSLDAARKDVKSVSVEYLTRNIDTSLIDKHFEDVDLESRYPGYYKVLAIRDSNTVGLEGPISKDDVKPRADMGRFLNLVTEICKAQKNLESGGSWGIGKTIYYRVGIGLVLFYTRIRNGNGYSSRLAAVCVEDEINDFENNIIQYADNVHPRGIAWWGERTSDGQFIPIVDEKVIAEILKDFDIPLYEGDETGTTIIIPFVNEEKLLYEVKAGDNKKNDAVTRWTEDLEWYLEIAVQRWYAPRLNNDEYFYGPKLEVFIQKENGKVKQVFNLPFFEVIQSLYRATPLPGKKIAEKNYFIGNKSRIEIESIEMSMVRTLKSRTVGYVHHIKIKNDDLIEKSSSHTTSPFLLIQAEDPDGKENPPIFAYVRKPGMIVSYCTPGEWCANVPNTKKNEYLVALFVANSTNKLIDMQDFTLEEYLRQSEMADHMEWEDNNRIPGLPRKMYIISKLKKAVNSKLKERYSEGKVDVTDGAVINKRLGKCLADLLLPSTLKATKPGVGRGNGNTGLGFGADPVPGDSVDTGIEKILGPVLNITGGPYFKDGQIEIETIIILNKCAHVRIQLRVETEKNSLSQKEWVEKLSLPFPGAFVQKALKFSIAERIGGSSVTIKDKSGFTYSYASTMHNSNSFDVIDIHAKKDRNYAIKTVLSYVVDPEVRFDIDVKEVK